MIEREKQSTPMLTKLHPFYIFLFGFNFLYGQQTSCDVTNPSPIDNYVFPSNKRVCFTENTTFNDVKLEDGAIIHIAPNTKLIFNTNLSTATGFKNGFEIEGSLEFNNNPNFSSDLDINISTTGTLSNQSGITIRNNATNLINNGTVDIRSTLNFGSPTAINYIENNKEMKVVRFNLSEGNNTFLNKGRIDVSNTIDNNATTLMVNCGEIYSLSSFNMGGSRIVNTGTVTIEGGNSDLSGTSRIENYGTFIFNNGINGNTQASIYNAGLVKLSTVNMNGMSLEGPKNNSSKGYFYTRQPLNPNGSKVGPNLNFTKYDSYNPDQKSYNQGENYVFSNLPNYVDANRTIVNSTVANVTFDCESAGNCSAPMIAQLKKCADKNGDFTTECVKIANTSSVGDPSKIGISTYKNNNVNWPSNIPNGAIVLSSKEKGFVISRVLNTDQIKTPVEGMLIYDQTDLCIKLYNGTTWHCIERSCNE